MKQKLIIAALVASALIFLSKDKISKTLSKYEDAFNQLQIKLRNISKVYVSSENLTGNISLNITNPTTLDIGVSTNELVLVKNLLFYTQDGTYFGEAIPNLSAISLPANQTTELKTIPIRIPLTGNLIQLGIELATNSSNIQVQAEIEVLGKTYIV